MTTLTVRDDITPHYRLKYYCQAILKDNIQSAFEAGLARFIERFDQEPEEVIHWKNLLWFGPINSDYGLPPTSPDEDIIGRDTTFTTDLVFESRAERTLSNA